MNTCESIATVDAVEYESVPVKNENIVHLPLGLLGFEHIKRYALLENPGEAPFRWLQVIDNPNLAFLVLPALETLPDYEPDVPAEDVKFLGLKNPSDALVYNIVTLRAKGAATLNLKGPIVINRFTLRGKQVVLANAARYSIQHPLPLNR
ncbi:MAG: flagellar assembly protein FliW [Verrucomicrobiota bacterium]